MLKKIGLLGLFGLVTTLGATTLAAGTAQADERFVSPPTYAVPADGRAQVQNVDWDDRWEHRGWDHGGWGHRGWGHRAWRHDRGFFGPRYAPGYVAPSYAPGYYAPSYSAPAYVAPGYGGGYYRY